MLVGVIIAAQLRWPTLFGGIDFLSYGRLRPVHTSGVIFAFGGNALFATSYYIVQRVCSVRLVSDKIAAFTFYGYQAVLVLGVLSYVLGYSQSKEYAELPWLLDILLAVVWVAYAYVFFFTIGKRKEKHIYVGLWFYGAYIIAVAVLHIFNNLEFPISLTSMKSYSVYAGVQDALVQWWYGHNAVAFFLTTPFLGLMYYFIPKAAERPVYSYRLSIIHFWSLIFIYMWAGPHHLLYTALPEWAQNLGVVFSVMLVAPSWGGMINGLLTLRGAWDKVRTDPVLKFLVVAVTGYGMATFEGPTLALKNVNAIAHFTDWIIAHVHVGALAWNGFLTFGMIYYLVPKMWKTKLYSVRMANTHFWIGTLGIVFYTIPLYIAGFTQATMWKQFSPDGNLVYGNFLDTVNAIMPMYAMRAIGGTLYITGAILAVINVIQTIRQGQAVTDELAEAPALAPISKRRVAGETLHHWLERKPVQMTIWATIAVAIGGAVQIIPTLLVKENIPTIAEVKPYTPLELEGRDLYIREGCVGCHTQMVRPFRSEVERYGEYSKAGEFVYDRPFLWGSKRTGPDLHRLGGKYNNNWHFNHMLDPRQTSAGSIMPSYPWLIKNELNTDRLLQKMRTLAKLGVPYNESDFKFAHENLDVQARAIANSLQNDPNFVADYEASKKNAEVRGEQFIPIEKREIVAMIAYLQRLGVDIKAKKETAEK